MTDAFPKVDLLQGAGSVSFVVVDDTEKATDLAGFLKLAPGLVHPDGATTLAHVVNHLSQGKGFSVIEDPDAFGDAYKKQLATEDPTAPWQEGVIRLTDFGIPEFATVLPPTLTDQQLLFFAKDGFTGLPYRVEVDLSAPREIKQNDYKAMDMKPVVLEEDFDAEIVLTDEDRAFLDTF